jgi:hypothetical protein
MALAMVAWLSFFTEMRMDAACSFAEQKQWKRWRPVKPLAAATQCFHCLTIWVDEVEGVDNG